MATVTSIDAVLTAHTGKFDAGMKRGQRGLKDLQTAAARSGGIVSGSLSRMVQRAVAFGAAFLSIRAGMRFFDESSERLDKLAKTGDTLGATTQEMQSFERTSKLAGVEMEALTKGLGFMERAIGKTKIGTETMQESAKQAFKNIGMDVAELEGMTLSEKFGKISEKLNGMATQEEKLAAGAQIFGRNVAELLPFIDAGASGLAESAAFARRFGIELDRMDLGKVERMNDTWDDVWRVIKGIGDQITVSMSTPLTWVAEKLLDVLENVQQIDVAANTLVGEFGMMAGVINIANNGLQLMVASAEWLEASLQGAIAAGMLFQGIWDKDSLAAGNILAAEADAMYTQAKQRFADVFSGATSERFLEDLQRINNEMQAMRGKAVAGAGGGGSGGGGAAVGAPRVAQRGSAESLAIINQMNRQKTMGDMIADAFKETMMEWSEKEMAMVEVTHTLIGDTNKHLEKIADAATDEPGDAI